MTANKTPNIVVHLVFCLILLLNTACSMIAYAGATPVPTLFIPPGQASQSRTPTFLPTATSTDTLIPPTLTPTQTDTPLPTETPLPTATATFAPVAAGELKIPILLYHHVSDVTPTNRYIVTLENFRLQMERLRALGYTTISMSNLVDVLINGGVVPAHPVVITFDDGNVDVYENAFPIMKQMNFTGVLYIVANRLESPGFMNVDQLKEMVAAGWEIGSHSETHVDLTKDHDIVRYEELQSRLDLEEALSVTVKTFAYPFGLTNEYVSQSAQDYGYAAAVGLGTSIDHTWGTLYYLSRREVQGDYSLDQFERLLTGPESPAGTPTPVP